MASQPVAARPPLALRAWPTWAGVGLLSVVCLLPAVARRGIAAVLAHLQVAVETGGSSRRRVRNWNTVNINLQACMPALDAAERKAFYRSHLKVLIGTVLLTPRLWFGTRAVLGRRTRFEGLDSLIEARNAGRPVVLLISHTVALDMGILALSPHFEMHGIYRPFDNPVIDWLVSRSRRRFGGEPTARGAGMRSLIKSLRAGKILCYLSDEDFGAEGSVFAPFFGHHKATLAMLPRIARLTDAVVIPMGVWLDDDQVNVTVRLFEPLHDYPGENEIENATRLNAATEAVVQVQPVQYLWKMRLFRTDPEGGGSRYARIERGELTPSDL